MHLNTYNNNNNRDDDEDGDGHGDGEMRRGAWREVNCCQLSITKLDRHGPAAGIENSFCLLLGFFFILYMVFLIFSFLGLMRERERDLSYFQYCAEGHEKRPSKLKMFPCDNVASVVVVAVVLFCC